MFWCEQRIRSLCVNHERLFIHSNVAAYILGGPFKCERLITHHMDLCQAIHHQFYHDLEYFAAYILGGPAIWASQLDSSNWMWSINLTSKGKLVLFGSVSLLTFKILQSDTFGLCQAIHYLFSHDLKYLAAWPEASSSQLFVRIQKRNTKLLETFVKEHT
jgi:hypothetical protein